MVGKYISYVDPIWGILSFKHILNLYSPKPHYLFFSTSPSISPMFKGFDSPPTRPPVFNNDQASTPEETDPSGEIFCFRRGSPWCFFREKLPKVLLMVQKPKRSPVELRNSSHYLHYLRWFFKHHRQGQEFWTINSTSMFYSKVFVDNVLGEDALQFCWRVLLRFLSLLAQ